MTEHPNWTIRDAVVADHASIAVMNEGIQEAERDVVGYPMLPPDRLPPAYLAEMLAAGPEREAELLVCVAEGRVVGFLSGHRASENDCLVEAGFNSFALVSDLFVEAEFRAQGVAQALLAEFSARMRAKGHTWLRICAKARNTKAVDAYLRFGFEPYETVFVKPL